MRFARLSGILLLFVIGSLCSSMICAATLNLAQRNIQYLEQAIANYQTFQNQPWPSISFSRKLRIGIKDKNVPLLR